MPPRTTAPGSPTRCSARSTHERSLVDASGSVTVGGRVAQPTPPAPARGAAPRRRTRTPPRVRARRRRRRTKGRTTGRPAVSRATCATAHAAPKSANGAVERRVTAERAAEAHQTMPSSSAPAGARPSRAGSRSAVVDGTSRASPPRSSARRSRPATSWCSAARARTPPAAARAPRAAASRCRPLSVYDTPSPAAGNPVPRTSRRQRVGGRDTPTGPRRPRPPASAPRRSEPARCSRARARASGRPSRARARRRAARAAGRGGSPAGNRSRRSPASAPLSSGRDAEAALARSALDGLVPLAPGRIRRREQATHRRIAPRARPGPRVERWTSPRRREQRARHVQRPPGGSRRRTDVTRAPARERVAPLGRGSHASADHGDARPRNRAARRREPRVRRRELRPGRRAPGWPVASRTWRKTPWPSELEAAVDRARAPDALEPDRVVPAASARAPRRRARGTRPRSGGSGCTRSARAARASGRAGACAHRESGKRASAGSGRRSPSASAAGGSTSRDAASGRRVGARVREDGQSSAGSHRGAASRTRRSRRARRRRRRSASPTHFTEPASSPCTK